MKVTCFVRKIKLQRLDVFVVVDWNCFVRSGRGRASVVVVCWVWSACCERGERRRWRERSEQTKNNVPIELARVLPSYVGQGLLKCDDRRATITSLASWRPCVSAGASSLARVCWQRVARSQRRASEIFDFVFVLVCWRVRSRGDALLMACAPCSELCARLNVVCVAGCCVRGSTLCVLGAVCASRVLLSIFCISTASETRMLYFLPMQIAACCLLVAVMAQAMNPADAEALNQTLTGLGCWQSSTCQTKNVNCSSTGVVACNANGSVTYL